MGCVPVFVLVGDATYIHVEVVFSVQFAVEVDVHEGRALGRVAVVVEVGDEVVEAAVEGRLAGELIPELVGVQSAFVLGASGVPDHDRRGQVLFVAHDDC